MLKHNHALLFVICACVLATTAELSSCDRDHIACKAENGYHLPVY